MANAESATPKSGASPTAPPPKGAVSQDAPAPKSPLGPRPKWRHYIEAAIAFVVMALLARLSMANAAGVGAWIARLIAPWTSSWQTAKKNLALAMPELGMFERRRIAAQAFDNFGRVMAEYCKLPWMWRTSWDSIVDVVGREHLQRAVAGGKRGVIIFTAHIGNWEIIPMVLAHAGRPVMLVYRAANNPLIDKRVGEIRGLYTAALAPKGAEGARAIVDHIQNGGVVYMVVDQKMNTGVEVPLFGVGAMTGKAIARIAMRHHCELLPARCVRLGRSQFRVTFEAPWFVPGDHRNENDVRDALAKINLKIEEWVRATPGQWLWMHRRWPKAAKRPA
jgi:KDO2-lipid IV(A) lauroyltransferase